MLISSQRTAEHWSFSSSFRLSTKWVKMFSFHLLKTKVMLRQHISYDINTPDTKMSLAKCEQNKRQKGFIRL
jgi:hypothetical protein